MTSEYPINEIAEVLGQDPERVRVVIDDWGATKGQSIRSAIPDGKLLASLSGLSTTSISNFVAGRHERLSPGNVEALSKLASLVGYIPSRAAQSLRNLSHDTVAIALPLTSVSPSFYVEILAGIKQEARALGYHYMIFDITTIEERESFFDTMPFLGMVDGLLSVGLELPDACLDILEKRRLPVVSVHSPLSRPPVVSDITTPGEKAFVELVDSHLIKHHGYRNLALVKLASENRLGTKARPGEEDSERVSAFRQALHNNGITLDPESIFQVEEHSVDEGTRVFEQIREANQSRDASDRIEAIVCTSDVLAATIYSRSGQSGIAMPVTGFDNLSISELLDITTIDQRPRELGSLAFRRFFESATIKARRGALPAPTTDSIDMRVVIRRSCGCTPPVNRQPPHDERAGVRHTAIWEDASSAPSRHLADGRKDLTKQVNGISDKTLVVEKEVEETQ